MRAAEQGRDLSLGIDHEHDARMIDPEGQVTALFSGPHRAENYVNDLPIVTRS